jgi:hypothetical protein
MTAVVVGRYILIYKKRGDKRPFSALVELLE